MLRQVLIYAQKVNGKFKLYYPDGSREDVAKEIDNRKKLKTYLSRKLTKSGDCFKVVF